jgi:hypothetical protein
MKEKRRKRRKKRRKRRKIQRGRTAMNLQGMMKKKNNRNLKTKSQSTKRRTKNLIEGHLFKCTDNGF